LSLEGYLAAEAPPARVVLCPSGVSVARDVAFLARAAGRLLWPAPPGGFQAAIGGLRAEAGASQPSRRRRKTAKPSAAVEAALLLEGEVGLARARAALAAAGPRRWIVETPGHVRIRQDHLEKLSRAGVRWSALEPVVLVALYATPALARARERWKGLLPASTRVWVRRR
jgi:hypothetical protein